MNNRYDRLIFVDTDDTARAPMAQSIMEALIKEDKLVFPCEVLSRGLVSLFPQPVNQKAQAVLVANGLDAQNHTATQLMQADITPTTLILTMEENQKGKIWEEYEYALHVFTLPGYLKIQKDISALFGAPLTEYGRCFQELRELVQALAEQLNKEVEEQ